jgi:glycosyltransferase involved in cell wall biosynthesis
MSLSKPVIAFNNGGPKEIIINNYNGYLIDDYNTLKYSESILRIYNDRNLAIVMGDKGRERFLKEFSGDIYSNNYLNEFKKEIE